MDYVRSKNIQVKDESDPILGKFLHERNLIKWSSRLKRDKLLKGRKGQFDSRNVVSSLYRPFTKQFLYFDYIPIDIVGQQREIFPSLEPGKGNIAIYCTDAGTQSPFMLIATNEVPDSHLVGTTAKCLPLYRYDKDGSCIDNITDWGLTQFQTHYNDPTITKLDIFHYTYSILHHPVYRIKYELNLKRELPRLPFYADFHQWATWGKTLMDLHLNYETIQPYGLERQEIATKEKPKAKLKADKTQGVIILDENSQLTGIPAIAWDYKLGNRSALEWILDQYKEQYSGQFFERFCKAFRVCSSRVELFYQS